MKWYICPDCGNVFRSDAINMENEYDIPCVIANCSGYMFEVDEEMIIPIQKLNRKGWGTRYCCSGHAYDTGCGGYIMFLDEYTKPDTLPKGWRDDGDCIRYDFKKNATPIQRQKTIHSKMDSLIKWCEELEANEWM